MIHRALAPAGVLLLTATTLLTGCVGQDKADPVCDDRSGNEVLAAADARLDETSGVDLTISSRHVPRDLTGFILLDATGTVVRPSAFTGTAKVGNEGLSETVDLVAVDGTLWAKGGILGPDYVEVTEQLQSVLNIDIPDPGSFIAADGGVSDLLAETSDLSSCEDVRGGSDNNEIHAEYTGTLSGKAIRSVVPFAEGSSFDVVYELNGDDELTKVTLDGAFYEGTDPMTYEIAFTAYDVEKEITAP